MSKLRLCLDLNIWCAALLADFKSRQNTSAQRLVQIVRVGHSSLGDVELVISWGMIQRLEKVLVKDLQIDVAVSNMYLEAIVGLAQLAPQLTLGGTGILPLRDTEDAHVLETAIAGKANVLVTANLKDFVASDTQIIIRDRYLIHVTPTHRVQIVHPYLMMNWLNAASIPNLDG